MVSESEQFTRKPGKGGCSKQIGTSRGRVPYSFPVLQHHLLCQVKMNFLFYWCSPSSGNCTSAWSGGRPSVASLSLSWLIIFSNHWHCGRPCLTPWTLQKTSSKVLGMFPGVRIFDFLLLRKLGWARGVLGVAMHMSSCGVACASGECAISSRTCVTCFRYVVSTPNVTNCQPSGGQCRRLDLVNSYSDIFTHVHPHSKKLTCW